MAGRHRPGVPAQPKLSLGLAYEYLNLGDASMSRDRGPVAGKLDGKYSTNEVHFVDFTISYKF